MQHCFFLFQAICIYILDINSRFSSLLSAQLESMEIKTSTSYQRLLSDGQRLFADASSASSKFAQPIMNAGTSISQVMGDIGVPQEFSGFLATNVLETPEIYELHLEVFSVDKDSIGIEVPDGHTLTILIRVLEDDSSIKKNDKMEEDAISPMAAETQAEPGQLQEV